MTIAATLVQKGTAVVSLECDTSVREAVAMLAKHKIGAAPVLKDGEVVGVMSERDVIYCLARDGATILDLTVAEVMTAPAITVTPAKEVLGALSLMTQRRIRHLPVLDDGRLVGFVSIGDLVKYRMDKIEQEAAAMLNYIQGT